MISELIYESVQFPISVLVQMQLCQRFDIQAYA